MRASLSFCGKLIYIFLIFLFFSTLTACEELAVKFTGKKEAIPSHSANAQQAEKKFWNTLHHGRYQDISDADKLLMVSYLENPNDPVIASHLGFLHIWKITEREREKNISPDIINEIILSKAYFKDSHIMNPNDARVLGFYGDSQLVSGQIFNDQREGVRGYFTLKQAINDWPEFNYFTAGYVMSVLSPQTKYFKEALQWQWKTLDACADHKIDRKNPDFSPYMHLATQQGPKRACWNSWIAPYNFEGFFMNMGDMLVKSGDVDTAIKIYRNAKLAKNYSSWPYREMLEKRINNANENVNHFQNKFTDEDKTILFNSGRGCVVCHQAS